MLRNGPARNSIQELRASNLQGAPPALERSVVMPWANARVPRRFSLREAPPQRPSSSARGPLWRQSGMTPPGCFSPQRKRPRRRSHFQHRPRAPAIAISLPPTHRTQTRQPAIIVALFPQGTAIGLSHPRMEVAVSPSWCLPTFLVSLTATISIRRARPIREDGAVHHRSYQVHRWTLLELACSSRCVNSHSTQLGVARLIFQSRHDPAISDTIIARSVQQTADRKSIAVAPGAR